MLNSVSLLNDLFLGFYYSSLTQETGAQTPPTTSLPPPPFLGLFSTSIFKPKIMPKQTFQSLQNCKMFFTPYRDWGNASTLILFFKLRRTRRFVLAVNYFRKKKASLQRFNWIQNTPLAMYLLWECICHKYFCFQLVERYVYRSSLPKIF